jgi:nucleoside-diphosphate-sugar epimerase
VRKIVCPYLWFIRKQEATMAKTALILGASGKIGRHFATAFANRGWEVRPYKRGTDMNEAAKGCDVIFNGLNPPNYHNWAKLIPEITAQVIAAGKSSGASVIVPGNVYVYGDQTGPWDETTPHNPVARKGEIRKIMEAEYRKASAGGLRVIMLHAGDFVDPDRTDDLMGLLVLKGLKAGKITSIGAPGVARSYAYLPDLAEVGVRLAELTTLPSYIDVPVPGLTFSITDLHREIERQTGRSLKLNRFPWWQMKLASPFWELAREFGEMRYLYETPHSLSGTTLGRLLPDFKGSSFETVVKGLVKRQG